ncbi:MAG: beta strand repeat-containing protein, partial [Blastocatellia bacterium]
MRTTIFLITLLSILALCPAITSAQTSEQGMQTVSGQTVSGQTIAGQPDLSIVIGERQVRFTPRRAVRELRFEVRNETGDLVYDSGPVGEIEYTWKLQNAGGEPMPPGLYAWTFTIIEPNAETAQTRKGHVIIERGQDQVWVSTAAGGGVGTDIAGGTMTVSRDRGQTIAGARAGGAESRASDRDQTGRKATPEGKTNLDNRQNIDGASSGTAGVIAKWITAQQLGDSILSESGTAVSVAGSYQINGQNALKINNALQSVFLGPGAGNVGPSGLNNVFIGTSAGAATTSGFNNMFMGTAAGQVNTSGSQNNAIGAQAGQALTTGNNNTFIGNQAGYNTTGGINNMFIGTLAGFANQTGANNTFIGFSAGQNSTGQSNMFFGVNAGVGTTTGGENTFIGVNAGTTNTTGGKNLLIGTNTKLGAANLTNAAALGYAAQVDASNALVLGGVTGVNGGTSVNVGIGKTNPAHPLDVTGTINTTTQYNLGGARILGNQGTGNLFAGIGAGASNTTGAQNTYVGAGAGQNLTTSGANAFFGCAAGKNATGGLNSFFGSGTGVATTSGNANVFMGY